MEKRRGNQYYGKCFSLYSKNVAEHETLRQVGTHADSLIGEAFRKGVTGFDRELAWEAVWKDATVPPARDLSTV